MKRGRRRMLAYALIVAIVAAAMPAASARSEAGTSEGVYAASVGTAVVLPADDYKTQLEEAKKKRDEYEKKKRELEKKQNDLKAEYKNIEEYIAEMDQKQSEIMVEIQQLEDELEQLNIELQETKEQLVEATRVADEQYENMRRRFQYLYEHGNMSELEMLLDSRNVSDILNYDEYTLSIRAYDYQLVCRYMDAKKAVELVKEKQEAQIATLSASKDLYEQDFEYAQEVIAKKQEALADYAALMEVNEEQLEESIADLNKANANVNQLQKEWEKQKAREAEEAARKQAEAQRKAEAASYGDVPHTGYSNADAIPKKDEHDPSKMIWPLPGDSYRGSGFGPRKAPTKGASTYHKGVDIGGKYGAQIVAALAGTVVEASYNSSAGNYVNINHGNGYMTRYLHCSKLLVKKGDKVLQGQVIALVGSTGVSTAPHLHFGVYIDGVAVDPLRYVRY